MHMICPSEFHAHLCLNTELTEFVYILCRKNTVPPFGALSAGARGHTPPAASFVILNSNSCIYFFNNC